MSSEALLNPEEPLVVSDEDAPAQPMAVRGLLESQAMKATLWTVMSYGSTQVLRVVNSLILTRLLVPEYFGLMTLVTTMVVGMNLLSDIGISPSVIRSERGDEPLFLNTVWTLQALRGLVLLLASVVLAWPIAFFYNDLRLRLLVPALSLSVFISGFNSTNLLSLMRHMGARRIFAFDLTAQIFGLIVTVVWALIQPSVWALVGGTIAASAFKLALSFFRPLIPGIRNSFRWDAECAKSLVHFGKWILLATAFFFFASQADRLILGKLVSFAVLGVYGIAFTLSDIPRQVILAFASRVGYPFIAKMAYLPIPEFRKIFLNYRFYVLLVGAASISLVVNFGGALVSVMYDSRYHDARWMIPILALGLWHTLLYTTTNPALLSLGKSQYNAYGNGAYCVAMLVGIPLGFHLMGMMGAVIAVAAGDFPLYLVTECGASREGISTWRQDALTTAIFLAMLGVGFGIRRSLL